LFLRRVSAAFALAASVHAMIGSLVRTRAD
jgi:hypothetical protein